MKERMPLKRFVRWQRNTLLLRMMVKRNGLLLLWNAGQKDGERKEYTITFTVDKEEEASSLVAAAVVDAVIKA